VTRGQGQRVILRPIRVGLLLGGFARAWLGPTWSRAASADASNMELEYAVDALEGYFCRGGRN